MTDAAKFAKRDEKLGASGLAEAGTDGGSEAVDVMDERWFEISDAVSVMLQL